MSTVKFIMNKFLRVHYNKRRLFTDSCRKMRFVQFSLKDVTQQKLGIHKTETNEIIDLSGVDPLVPNSLITYIQNSDKLSDLVHRLLKEEKQVYKLHDVHLLAPISRPDKVICVGLNYKDHCDEQKKPYPEEPFFFNKFPSTIIGPDSAIKHPSNTKALDWEVELAVVIGKTCKDVDIKHAYDYVFGYTIAQDISARDWQTPKKNNGQWLVAKSMDTFCPLGPVVVTKEDITDPHNLDIFTYINDQQKQKSNTRELIHRIDKLVSFLSGLFTLLPGDIILTGTPGGVGVFRNPREFLKPGDVVRSEIVGIGTLNNHVS